MMSAGGSPSTSAGWHSPPGARGDEWRDSDMDVLVLVDHLDRAVEKAGLPYDESHIVEYTAGDVEILVAEGTAQTNDDDHSNTALILKNPSSF